jgi:RNA polymerase sigma-70 factor, ECF subfamily
LIDFKIIEECRTGNLNNFGKLVRMTTPFAFSVAFRILGNEDDAKDTIQDIMVTIWQKLEKIKTADAYKMWVYRLIVNRCYDVLRKRKRNPETLADDKLWELLAHINSHNPERELENNEMSAVISLLTGELSEKQRIVFVLSEIEDMSNDEIISVTGMNRSSVKSNLYHARKNIGEKLKKYV